MQGRAGRAAIAKCDRKPERCTNVQASSDHAFQPPSVAQDGTFVVGKIDVHHHDPDVANGCGAGAL